MSRPSTMLTAGARVRASVRGRLSFSRRALSLALVATLALSTLAPAAAQNRVSLRDLLLRAGAYVVAYGEALATVVADEAYVQQLVAPGGQVIDERVLHSEIAFVSLAGSGEWQAFRNVLRVDGVDVGGAERRLERLLRDAPLSVVDQARRIATESARYNLGPLVRTFNAPTMPLQFLHPAHQERFRFDRRGEETIGGDAVWVVRFRDRGGSTLIRSTTGRAVPVEGQVHIAVADGRVLQASFTARDFLPEQQGRNRAHAALEVTWQPEARLGILVPAEMRERYAGPWEHEGLAFDITGAAHYSNFRRFEVDARVIGVPR